MDETPKNERIERKSKVTKKSLVVLDLKQFEKALPTKNNTQSVITGLLKSIGR